MFHTLRNAMISVTVFYFEFFILHIVESMHWGDPGINGRIILGWMFRKWDLWVWTGLGWLRIEAGGGSCECGNEPSGSIKCREFLN
jgi:hypothetical protein